MSLFSVPKETNHVALLSKRDVTLTMPWFSELSKYPPRAANVVNPLINGERAFGAAYEAIKNAKKSIDMIGWGFDPSMRFLRPNGLRIGELLQQKAKAGVEVRVLVWKNALANFGENNIIGDGMGGSGGGTGLGSGIGRTGATDANQGGEYNDYGGKRGSGTSGAIQQRDEDALAFNRAWFAADVNLKKLSFRTRDFSRSDQDGIAERHVGKHGMDGHMQRIAFVNFPSHHQKMILVDYEVPEDAVGFVMGHNMLRNYWDNDAHDYQSAAREGFAPWQDLSTRVWGPVLYDLNENFSTAWMKAQPWIGYDLPISPARMAIKPTVFEAPARQRGNPEPAQIVRTQAQENERSILDAYKLALVNARSYVYFENQYFRSKEIAMHMRAVRKALKKGGWKRDFYVFVVTNVPDDHGRMTTYEMLHALGKGQNMPRIDKEETDDGKKDKDRALPQNELDGMHIHVCTLVTSGQKIGHDMETTLPEPFMLTKPASATSPQIKKDPFAAPSGTAIDPQPMKTTMHARPYTAYKDIYVHSKLLLVDDVFFTFGSANVNTRSFEVDSELNIAMPSPTLTREWREHLWRIHTGRSPLENPAKEFDEWDRIMKNNAKKIDKQQPLYSGTIIEFYDDAKTGGRAD